MLDINKQEMKYSQFGQRVFIPQTDENGDIVYEGYKDSDGNFVPYLDSEGNKIPKGEEVEGFQNLRHSKPISAISCRKPL